MPDNNNDFFGSLGLELESDVSSGYVDESADTTENITKEKLSEISRKTFQMLDDEHIFPFPENFESIFERNLNEEQNEDVRNKIRNVLESRHNNANVIALETAINKSFTNLKSIFEQVGVLCKQLESFEVKMFSQLGEIDKIENPLAVKNAITILLNSTNTTYKRIFDQTKVVVENYTKMYEDFLNIKKKSMFDVVLGIYNKQFFFQKLDRECLIGKDFAGENALFIVALSDTLLDSLKSKKSLISATKMISKILLDKIGKEDSICALHDTELAIFMKNVSYASIRDVGTQLIDSLKKSTVFLDDVQIALDVVVGATKFDPNSTPQENIQNARSALEIAKSENKKLEIFKPISSEDTQEEDFDSDFGNFEIP